MNGIKMKKMALALGSLALIATATDAFALPQFTINPNAIPGTTGKSPVTADFISGTSTELLTATSASTFSGTGYLALSGYSLNGSPIFNGANLSGLGTSYQLYITFNFTDSLKSGTFGADGSTYNLDTLSFSLYADPQGNNQFAQASVSGNTGNAPTISNMGDDILLGFGSLLGGTASLNGGGAGLNSTELLALCSGAGQAKIGTTTFAAAQCTAAYGTNYFTAPVPFYSFAFDEFNNTSSGVSRTTSGQQIAITGASGGINFAVPEPDSIALLGIAAVAAGLATRRRKA